MEWKMIVDVAYAFYEPLAHRNVVRVRSLCFQLQVLQCLYSFDELNQFLDPLYTPCYREYHKK